MSENCSMPSKEPSLWLKETYLLPTILFLAVSRPKGGELEFESYDLDEIEKTVIQKVLKQYQGNITQAAQELGLTRTSLYRRMEKHGL